LSLDEDILLESLQALHNFQVVLLLFYFGEQGYSVRNQKNFPKKKINKIGLHSINRRKKYEKGRKVT